MKAPEVRAIAFPSGPLDAFTDDINSDAHFIRMPLSIRGEEMAMARTHLKHETVTVAENAGQLPLQAVAPLFDE